MVASWEKMKPANTEIMMIAAAVTTDRPARRPCCTATRADAPWAGGTRAIQTASVVAAASLLAVVLVALMLNADGRLSDEAAITDAFGSPAAVGELFLTDHLLAFEITSIVLLVAAVGGVVLGMRSADEEEGAEA